MCSFMFENHSGFVIEAFQDLLEHDELLDCTLAAEGQYLKGHKILLAACSSYLKLLFTQEPERSLVTLEDVKIEDLKSLFEYLYFGETVVHTENLGSFLHAARTLQIKGLAKFYNQKVEVEQDCDLLISNDLKDWTCKNCDGEKFCEHHESKCKDSHLLDNLCSNDAEENNVLKSRVEVSALPGDSATKEYSKIKLAGSKESSVTINQISDFVSDSLRSPNESVSASNTVLHYSKTESVLRKDNGLDSLPKYLDASDELHGDNASQSDNGEKIIISDDNSDSCNEGDFGDIPTNQNEVGGDSCSSSFTKLLNAPCSPLSADVETKSVAANALNSNYEGFSVPSKPSECELKMNCGDSALVNVDNTNEMPNTEISDTPVKQTNISILKNLLKPSVIVPGM